MSASALHSTFMEFGMAQLARLMFMIIDFIVLACLVGIGCCFLIHFFNNGVPCGSVSVALTVPSGILVGVPAFWLLMLSVSLARVVPDELVRVHVPAIDKAFRWDGLVA